MKALSHCAEESSGRRKRILCVAKRTAVAVASILVSADMLAGTSIGEPVEPAFDTRMEAGEQPTIWGGNGPSVDWTLTLDYNTHFVSYGADTWQTGSSLRSSRSGTFDPSIIVSVGWDAVSVYAGAWADVNNYGIPQYGDRIQEVDVWTGVGYRRDRFEVGATYQEWYYLDQTEHVIDTWLYFDDTDLLFKELALKPSLLLHNRIGAKYANTGAALEARLDPGFSVPGIGRSLARLSVPVRIGFLEKGFWNGDGGFGYASIGAQLSQPLTSNPQRYGAWNATFGLTFYYTNDDVIPDNTDASFLTGNIGLSLLS